MPTPIIAPIPEFLDLAPGYTVRVTAIDPATAAAVNGVKVTTTVIEAEGEGDFTSGNFVVGNPLLIGTSI